MKRKILFIVNPVSGHASGKKLPRQLSRNPLYDGVDYAIRFTERPGHARELAARAAGEGFSLVVAVGGDGTVNEVGGALSGTETLMGIVPLGSGNGFARHLGYSMRVDKALAQLLVGPEERVDVMDINGRCSLNVSGLGFDAAIAHVFARGKARGLLAYAWAATRAWFSYKESDYIFRVGDEEWSERCFIVSLANSSQYGYNFVIAPGASARDGLLDLCIMRRPRLYEAPYYLFCAATGRVDRLSRFRRVPCAGATIRAASPEGHLDGDPCTFTSPVQARIIAGALRVIVPGGNG